MDIESFRECSLALENFIRDVGMSRWDGTTMQRCSGELLFDAVSQRQAMESVISSSEQMIILKLGSRVTSCDGFTGRTSHGVACGLLARIMDDYGPSIRQLIGDPLHLPTWGTIPKNARDTLSSWELELNPRPLDWATAADSVYTERILFLKSAGVGDATSAKWVPNDTHIERVKIAVSKMLDKKAGVKAIAREAKMRPERVSIILKMIQHKAE